MRRTDLLLCAVVLAWAYLVKRHYSDASADELDYILRPTAGLVQAGTGTSFVREPHWGYFSRQRSFVIAKPCAGVNFWLAATSAAVVAFVGTRRTLGGKLLLVAGAVAVGFGATIVANAIRIVLAVKLHTDVGAIGGLAEDRVHHIEGVAVYTVCLCLFFLVARRFLVAREV